MALSNQVLAAIDERAVQFFYLSRDTAKFWNGRRDDGEPMVFCGWYWAKGRTEGGPFKSRQAAMRDAWYHLIQKVAPPRVQGAEAAVSRPKLHVVRNGRMVA